MEVNPRRNAIMMAQFRAATKEPNEFLKFHITEDDTSTWYILLSGFSGDDDEFAGGEYLVKVVMPPKFPYDPPEFYFITRQGLYDINKKVCISIGEFHASDYRSALGVIGFCTQLVSGLIGWRTMGVGISILSTTAKEKAKLAAASVSTNYDSHSEIMEAVNLSYAMYSTKWPEK